MADASDADGESDRATKMARISQETHRRLSNRKQQRETRYETMDEVIDRLLDETTTYWTIEEVIDELDTRFENIASIGVDLLPVSENPTTLSVVCYTGEADGVGEHYFAPFDEGEHRVIVEHDDGYPLIDASLRVYATMDGPKSDIMRGYTVLYMADSVLGSDYKSSTEGLADLREQFPDYVCDGCGVAHEGRYVMTTDDEPFCETCARENLGERDE